jgi:uncharacterized membrane protein HdeD (DUF308 family)
MVNALSILLLVAGLILVVGAVELPTEVTDVVSAWTLGWTLLIVGVLARVSSLALDARRQRAHAAADEGRDV